MSYENVYLCPSLIKETWIHRLDPKFQEEKSKFVGFKVRVNNTAMNDIEELFRFQTLEDAEKFYQTGNGYCLTLFVNGEEKASRCNPAFALSEREQEWEQDDVDNMAAQEEFYGEQQASSIYYESLRKRAHDLGVVLPPSTGYWRCDICHSQREDESEFQYCLNCVEELLDQKEKELVMDAIEDTHYGRRDETYEQAVQEWEDQYGEDYEALYQARVNERNLVKFINIC